MASYGNRASFSFAEFPEDVQLCILSFLSPKDVARFSCTSKRFVSLCRDGGKLWHAMCNRKWGTKTQVQRWGSGRIAYKVLYSTLNEWEKLIGFWRRCGQANFAVNSPPLIYFEWGPSFVSASRVSPSNNGTYEVTKSPFLWMGMSSAGRVVNLLDLDGDGGFTSDFEELGTAGGDFVPVNVSFMGYGHILVEEKKFYAYSSREETMNECFKSSGSGDEGDEFKGSPDYLVTEMYTQIANRTSPGDRRRHRKREKERLGRSKWEPEHFVKVFDCYPTPARPLQGLWKGFCRGINLDFYFIKYDELGGIICRKVGDLSSCSSAPVFWTSDPTYVECPFSPEEEHIYEGRMNSAPLAAEDEGHSSPALTGFDLVSKILYINSSYDLAMPGLVGSTTAPRNGEGRIWVYRNGTFGFGFLRDKSIVDLKHIAQDGFVLDNGERSRAE